MTGRGDRRGRAQAGVRFGCQLDRDVAGRGVDGGPHREARTQPPPPGGEPSRAFEREQSQLALRHLGRAASAVMACSRDRGMVPAASGWEQQHVCSPSPLERETAGFRGMKLHG
jgi:hypothetical protein